VLEKWFEMPTTCENQRQYCQAILYLDTITYWVEAQQKQLGNSKNGGSQLSILDSDIAYIDNKIWLKYTVFPKWLPVSAGWTLYRYAISPTPPPTL
jgi:hypothetical protein